MIDDLIYDVGMNTGEDTDFYLRKGFRVVAIEANVDQIRQAQTRFAASIRDARLQLLNVAIGQAPGRMPFYVNHTHHEWSSLFEAIGTRDGRFHAVDVDVVTFDQVVREYGIPYYAKIDIEGMDRIAALALAEFADRPRYLSLETGPGTRFLQTLQDLSYRWFKIVNQSAIVDAECPNPAREGTYVDYQFKAGSSGPFGEETPGPWLSGDEAHTAWTTIVAGRQPGQDLWFDIHAKLR